MQVAAETVQAEGETDSRVDLGPARLPVLLRLADYEGWRWETQTGRDTGRPLSDFVGRQPWLQQSLHPDPATGQAIVLDFLRRGQALLLFDGLDEIVDATHRGVVIAAVESFVRTWVREPGSESCPLDEGFVPTWREEDRPARSGGNQLLLTSRPIGYYLAPLASAVPHYSVEEMSEAAVRSFCRAWAIAVYAETALGDPQADGEALEDALWDKAGPGLREIVVNPLLLTILAGLHYTLEGPLPERRVQLYDAVTAAFVRQRADAWQTAHLGDERIRYALGYAAAQLHASPSHPNGLVEGDELVDWLAEALEEYEGVYLPRQGEQAQALLDAARSLGGFLLERGQAIYGFIHRTFQEYFAAHYLAAHRKEATARILARLDDPAWQEVLVLAVAEAVRLRPRQTESLLRAILHTPESLPGLIPQRALFLARCLPELPPERIPESVTAAVVEGLAAAYVDRGWPPDASTQRPQSLRKAIEAVLGRLHSLPGAVDEIGRRLMDEQPTRRLAAAELILETDWVDAALVAPLLETARTYAEPVATVREALLRCYGKHPAAFTPDLLPMARLLADETLTARRWQNPFWQIALRFLYLRPNVDWTSPPRPDDLCFDSHLTPWLVAAWHEERPDEFLAAQCEDFASSNSLGGVGRDAALLLFLWQEQPSGVFPGAEGDQTGAECLGLIPLCAWVCDRARARARDLARDLDLALARDLAREIVDEIGPLLAGVQARLQTDEANPPQDDDELSRTISSSMQRLQGLRQRLLDPVREAAIARLVHLLQGRKESMREKDPIVFANQGRLPLASVRMAQAEAWPRPVQARLTLPEEAQERSALLPWMEEWARSDDPLLANSGHLLLAEMGVWDKVDLDQMADLLVDKDDLFRYRARKALLVDQMASLWGREHLVWLAGGSPPRPLPVREEEGGDGYLVETLCGWALNRVEHDCPDWLVEWATASRTEEKAGRKLLGSIHKLSAAAWPLFLELLQNRDLPTLSLIIDSAVELLLAQAPPGRALDGTLARLAVNRQAKPKQWSFASDDFDPSPALAEMAALRPDLPDQLRAFLSAGSDDDVWEDSYHGRAAACLSMLVQQHGDLLPALLDGLAGALDEDAWPRHRIALAGLARLAQAAPGLFNRAGAQLQTLLLRASAHPHSFSARRFAITALSYLREITPEVLAALLRLAGDESIVQKDVIEAAGRFNRLHPRFGEELPAALVAALSGVSSVRAYVAVRVLETLGTSSAARSAPALRGRIVDVLAAALRDESSRRPVWLWTGSDIKQEGTLDQHLYTALLRVAGFSG